MENFIFCAVYGLLASAIIDINCGSHNSVTKIGYIKELKKSFGFWICYPIVLFTIPSENMRKPLVFWYFQGVYIVCTPPPFCRGEALSLQLNFQKGEGGLGMTSTFTGGCWEKGGVDFFQKGVGRGGGVQFSHKKWISYY